MLRNKTFTRRTYLLKNNLLFSNFLHGIKMTNLRIYLVVRKLRLDWWFLYTDVEVSTLC